MAVRVGVEPALTSVSDYLKNKGYDVETVSASSEKNTVTGYDAFVVTGLNVNMTGVNDTQTNAIIIDASGMTPEQVYMELQTRIQ